MLTPRPLLTAALVATTWIAATGCGDDGATSAPTTELPTTEVPTTELPDADLVTCESPEGYSIAHPADWGTNPGDVVPRCGWFGPDPIALEPGTDARAAPVAVFVEPVSYADVAPPGPTLDERIRSTFAVDGHQALRVAGVTTGEGLGPAGREVTRYAVDLSIGADDGPGTLIAEARTFGGVGADEAARVLDRMMATLDLGTLADGADVAGTVVARSEGGGQPFVVVADPSDCPDGGLGLFVDPPEAAPSCVGAPGPEELRPVTLSAGSDGVRAGAAGARVARVDLVDAGGAVLASAVPVVVEAGATTAYGFAAGGAGEPARVVWYDLAGGRLGSTDA